MNRGLGAGLIFAAALLPATLHAQSLVYVAVADNGDELYVDRTSLRTIPPVAEYRPFVATQIWAVNQVKAARRSPARTERFLFSFDCARRTSQILVYQNNRTGIRLQDWRAADLGYKYEAPRAGSLAEFSMLFACSGGRLPVVPRATTEEAREEEEAETP